MESGKDGLYLGGNQAPVNPRKTPEKHPGILRVGNLHANSGRKHKGFSSRKALRTLYISPVDQACEIICRYVACSVNKERLPTACL
jgi:hypothetical protein